MNGLNNLKINKMETLEEFIKNGGYPTGSTQEIWEQGVREGAKWQQERLYSEEEVKRICSKAWLKTPNTPNMLEEFDKWFEQVKKK